MSEFFRAFRRTRGGQLHVARGHVGRHRHEGMGRSGQLEGRHTVEYVTRHGGSPLTMVGQPADGMQALGGAGRQSLDDLYAAPFRGAGSLA